jgi:hypothetical protein
MYMHKHQEERKREKTEHKWRLVPSQGGLTSVDLFTYLNKSLKPKKTLKY